MKGITDWLAHQFRDQGWIDHWQTLIAGSLAILAAIVGGIFINRQIRAAKTSEIEARQRKFDAARAVLPLILSALSEYAIRCNKLLMAIHATKAGENIPKQAAPSPPPPIPSGVIDDLRAIIEHSDEPFRGNVKRLIGQLQVQVARIGSMVTHLKAGYDDDHSITALNIETYMIDGADIYARCSALFDFARGTSDEVPGGPTRADIRTGLRQTGIWEDLYPRTHQRVDAHYDH